jgi:hypothetical protein
VYCTTRFLGHPTFPAARMRSFLHPQISIQESRVASWSHGVRLDAAKFLCQISFQFIGSQSVSPSFVGLAQKEYSLGATPNQKMGRYATFTVATNSFLFTL